MTDMRNSAPVVAGVSHFLRDHDEPVLLSVIGRNQAGQLAQIVGEGHPTFTIRRPRP